MTPEQETFTISELAVQLDISTSTIRFYEEKGLLSPRRTDGNHRVYTAKDRGRLKLILRGKHFGASLDEIAEMVGMADGDMDEVHQIDRSLYYVEKKFLEIERKKQEIDLFERDLSALKEKLLGRKGELETKK